MDDIKSQIERSEQLLKELEGSVNADLTNKEVSSNTRNLTQEILVKTRSILDQSMRYFWEKEIGPSLSKEEQEKAKIYFPIVPKQEDLKSMLGRAKMKDLATSHPGVHSYLEATQPYHKGKEWLNDLVKYSNERHIRLSPQKKVESKRLVLGDDRAQISIGQGAQIRMGKGTSIRIGGRVISGGQTLSADSNFVRGSPGVARKETWVQFLFEGTTTNSLGLCKKAVEDGKKIALGLLDLCS